MSPHLWATGPELLPEGLVVDLGRDLEPPAVDPEAEPVLGDAKQELADLRLVRVELWQGWHPPPRVIPEGRRWGACRRGRHQRPTCSHERRIEVEPRSGRRIRATLQYMMKRPED